MGPPQPAVLPAPLQPYSQLGRGSLPPKLARKKFHSQPQNLLQQNTTGLITTQADCSASDVKLIFYMWENKQDEGFQNSKKSLL